MEFLVLKNVFIEEEYIGAYLGTYPYAGLTVGNFETLNLDPGPPTYGFNIKQIDIETAENRIEDGDESGAEIWLWVNIEIEIVVGGTLPNIDTLFDGLKSDEAVELSHCNLIIQGPQAEEDSRLPTADETKGLCWLDELQEGLSLPYPYGQCSTVIVNDGSGQNNAVSEGGEVQSADNGLKHLDDPLKDEQRNDNRLVRVLNTLQDIRADLKSKEDATKSALDNDPKNVEKKADYSWISKGATAGAKAAELIGKCESVGSCKGSDIANSLLDISITIAPIMVGAGPAGLAFVGAISIVQGLLKGLLGSASTTRTLSKTDIESAVSKVLLAFDEARTSSKFNADIQFFKSKLDQLKSDADGLDKKRDELAAKGIPRTKGDSIDKDIADSVKEDFLSKDKLADFQLRLNTEYDFQLNNGEGRRKKMAEYMLSCPSKCELTHSESSQNKDLLGSKERLDQCKATITDTVKPSFTQLKAFSAQFQQVVLWYIQQASLSENILQHGYRCNETQVVE